MIPLTSWVEKRVMNESEHEHNHGGGERIDKKSGQPVPERLYEILDRQAAGGAPAFRAEVQGVFPVTSEIAPRDAVGTKCGVAALAMPQRRFRRVVTAVCLLHNIILICPGTPGDGSGQCIECDRYRHMEIFS